MLKVWPSVLSVGCPHGPIHFHGEKEPSPLQPLLLVPQAPATCHIPWLCLHAMSLKVPLNLLYVALRWTAALKTAPAVLSCALGN